MKGCTFRNYESIPFVLNEVPQLISRIYEKTRTARETELERLGSKIKSLEALDTSDF